MRNPQKLILFIGIIAISIFFSQCRSRKEKVECTEAVVETDTIASSPLIRNELIIRFTEGFNMDAFTENYLSAGLELLRPLDAAQTIWLAGFDTMAVKPEQMIERLREDLDVQVVEFNKRTKLRR